MRVLDRPLHQANYIKNIVHKLNIFFLFIFKIYLNIFAMQIKKIFHKLKNIYYVIREPSLLLANDLKTNNEIMHKYYSELYKFLAK